MDIFWINIDFSSINQTPRNYSVSGSEIISIERGFSRASCGIPRARARLAARRGRSFSSLLVHGLRQLAQLLFLPLLPPCSRRSRILAAREIPRQSCLDKHERFVCIVLRQRQHVSRTEVLSLHPLLAYRLARPSRGKNSLVPKVLSSAR